MILQDLRDLEQRFRKAEASGISTAMILFPQDDLAAQFERGKAYARRFCADELAAVRCTLEARLDGLTRYAVYAREHYSADGRVSAEVIEELRRLQRRLSVLQSGASIRGRLHEDLIRAPGRGEGGLVKSYILTQSDLDRLKLMVDRDPQHGVDGGSAQADVNDPGRRMAYDEAHRFYNYQIHKWIDEVSSQWAR